MLSQRSLAMRVRAFMSTRGSLVAVWLVWAAAVAASFGYLWGYSFRRSPVGEVPAHWPVEARIPFQPGVTNLVMAAHPHCPCTRASIGQLARLMAESGGHLAAHVLLVRPQGTSEEWVDTDLAASAAAIPGVIVQRDDGGREAACFGALSSGHVAVYDGDGALRFAGGLTAERGHEGDSLGSAAVLAVVEHGDPAQAQAPVFGCSLLEEQPNCRPGGDTCQS